ncbi:MAG: hypothetical protein OHK93_006112 [Ramalina farinacea]|uniref:DUF7704 domain-containing protein n=1 Tax=Ramalina farinacea TaxID=258253 RepID=A0AA43QHX4_9LECA|nr:hypothetical protein [Ramalina farinacea]
MASILAPIPRFIFTVFEPLSLVAGFAVPILNPSYFVSLQVPSQAPSAVPYNLTPTDRILALQLANTYGLLCMVGVGVLYATTEPKVVRNYLIACAIADVGHGWATGAVMGWEDFVNVGGWNEAAWGNLGVTLFLFVSRILWFAGLLGKNIEQGQREQGFRKTQ